MLRLVTAPADPVVTLTEAKAHLRVDHTDDDALITALVAAATARLDGRDGILGRALMPQQWEYVASSFPQANIPLQLPLPPTANVVSITYLHENGLGSTVTMDSDEYRVVAGGFAGAQIVPEDEGWPSADSDEPDVVRVTFNAGYANSALVPTPIKHAILLMVGTLYERRSDEVIGTNVAQADTVAALIAPYRLVPCA